MSSVLVTGTSSGIGLATAIVLGRAGHTVYATMRNPERAPQLREMVAKEKLPVSILTMDVDSDESVAETASAVRSQAKFIEVLINNAGTERRGAIEEFSWEDFRATMETNYFGALRCIDTPMARRLEAPPGLSHYPQCRRVAGMFEASLTNPTTPSLVAEKIREIIESGTWQLRHPVGPDAEPFLRWRESMTDEEWITWGALDDDAWYDRVQKDFGLDARPKKHA